MTIHNVSASLAVKDIRAATAWYEKLLGRPADAAPTPELAEWAFPEGGRLQVYALAERAGDCSCTLSISGAASHADRIEKLGIVPGFHAARQAKVFMVKDPDGNSIAFAPVDGDQRAGQAHDNVATARANYEAYVAKDRAVQEKSLAEDFHFTSPLDNRIDRKTYFERCWPNSENTAGFELVHLAPHGDRVFVTYEGTTLQGHRFRNTEILTFRQGRIVDVEVYFGWPVPHPAREGGFIDNQDSGTRHP